MCSYSSFTEANKSKTCRKNFITMRSELLNQFKHNCKIPNHFELNLNSISWLPLCYTSSLSMPVAFIVCLKKHNFAKHAKFAITITSELLNIIVWIDSEFVNQVCILYSSFIGTHKSKTCNIFIPITSEILNR